MLISLGNHALILKKKKPKTLSKLLKPKVTFKEMQSCWYYLTLAYFPLPWQILETQLNHKKKEEGRILVTCSLMEQKPTPEGGKPGHQPHGQSQGVGCLSCKKGRSHTGSQHSPPQPCTAHPLQEGTEHYLKARKASDEQTFITECTSAKTKIHASFWCWHADSMSKLS